VTSVSTAGGAADEIDPTSDAFQWQPIGDGPAEEGFLEVPLDWDEPGGEQITLRVVRNPAPEETRIGSLLVNPGGPGFGGSSLAEFGLWGPELRASFDIVGWDPRGTGGSEPAIECIDDWDTMAGILTGSGTAEEESAQLDAAREFAEGCVERSGGVLDHVSTIESARDMDAIRAALQEDEISYFGMSYGTQLGATWATMFPDTVRAAVLDGARHPTAGRVEALLDQAAGLERTLSLYLASCSADPTCAFHNDGDAEGAFTALASSLDEHPIATATGRPPLVSGVFDVAVAQALYSDVSWPQLSEALGAAQAGDGSGLLELYDEFYRRLPDGTYGNELEAYLVITCADDPATGGVQAAMAERSKFAAASRIGLALANELVLCAALPTQPSIDVEITGEGAGPILVIGNTEDPATPYEGSRRMAEALEDGTFVTVDATQHTAYLLNDCINTVVDSFLVDLTLPADDTTC
jgi:pimeloyl-ACP methyl ester carboxylesterase